MRRNALTLAIVALVALSATGVVAASMTAPTADTPSAAASPANQTIDVVNPEEVSDEEVDQAVDIAWANDEVQSYFDDDAAVHFEVWASELKDGIVHVDVAPQDAPDETRVTATVDLDAETVTDVSEPVKLNASSAISINETEYGIVSDDGDEFTLNDNNDEDSTEQHDINATKITADQVHEEQFNMSTAESQDNGVFTIELE
ncbi:hypothetical protein [Halorientalis halophila]|uniref:hypothetical protein n=1 Tax=Halorientalis halophila TaxID=3108499 RepID=UPI00300BF269